MAASPHGVPRSASAPPGQVGYEPSNLAIAAGDDISSASRRLRALAALSGSLTDALDPQDAADLVEQKALSALGATSAVVMTRGPFPPLSLSSNVAPVPGAATSLSMVHAIGLPAEVKALLDQLPIEAPVPMAEVARLGEPLFLESAEEVLRYPEWGAAMVAAGTRAAAIVPVWSNGELRGVLGLAWPVTCTFNEDERAFVLTLGVMCAQAIMRSHLRKAERQAREDAERANVSKTRFLATISHELRTPMNAVIGYTELLSDEINGPVSALQRDHLSRMRTSGKHLLGLIEELLGYARLEAGSEVVDAELVVVGDIVEQSLVLVRPIAERKGVSIRVRGVHDLVRITTESLKLRQILVNLFANAVKFSDDGEIILSVRVENEGADATILFEVTDSGRGIPLRDHERIFDAFWQGDPTLKRTAGGTGLGLSVARQLARLLGGDVTVARSAPGEGSTFVLSLPAEYPGPTATATASAIALPLHPIPLIA